MKKQNNLSTPFGLPEHKLFNKQIEHIYDDIKKRIDETIRVSFKNIIQPSFLIKMKYRIMNSEEFLSIAKQKYDPIGMYQNLEIDLFTVEDVCKNIAYIHQYNMSIVKNPTDFEDETHNGRGYFEKLKNQVIDNIKFRKLGSATFSNHYSFGYYPYLYALRVAVHFFSLELDKVLAIHFNTANGIERFRLRTISDIFRRTRGILGLMDDDCTDACYGICRQIIEFNTHYTILVRFPDAIEEYGKFVNYQIQYNLTKNFLPEFEEKYNLTFEQEKTNRQKKIRFLNYGWMDKIEEFKNLKNKKYSVKGLFEFIDIQNSLRNREIRDGEIMKDYYEKCSLLSHGNQVIFNYFLGNIEIAIYIFPIIEALAKDLRDMYGIAEEIEGINVLEYTRKRIDDAESKYRTISNDKELREKNQKLFMR